MSTISASTTSTTAYKVTADTTGKLDFQTGSTPTTYMTLDGSGNLGIGTTSPSVILDVQSASPIVKATATTGTNPASFRVVNTGGTSYFARDSSTGGFTGTAYATFVWGNGAYPMVFATNDLERARIDSSGNFGIGTTSPNAKLAVNGSATLANGGYLGWGNADTLIYGDSASNYMYFRTNGAEKARIDSSGNLLVGTTTTYAKLVASQSNAALRAGTFENTGTNSYSGDMLLLYYSGGTPNTASANFLRATDTTNDKFIVATTGNVTNRNNSYGGISDVKLKENITDATPKLAQLSQVRVVNYNFIGSEEKQLGVVAQEIEAIFPALVTETPDVDNDGNDLGTTTKSVKYSVFVPMLIKAMQEQQAIIETLTNRITALEAK